MFLQPFYIGFMMLITGIALANAGNAMNPARDFSPRLFTWIVGYGSEVWSYNDYCWFWIPLVFPFIGAGLGAWMYHLLIGIHIWNREDEEKTPILPISLKPSL
uniref:Aquaporin n=1 Tax=Steinernema glaseri TaxID=37863 RepID=A0A1I8A3B1_9BILA